MEIGIDSFAAILPDPVTGQVPSATDRMAELIEEVELAAMIRDCHMPTTRGAPGCLASSSASR